MQIGLLIATWLERGILALLIVLSIVSIAVMIDRRRALARQKRTEELGSVQEAITRKDRGEVERWIETNPGIHGGALHTVLTSTKGAQRDTERVDRAVRAYLSRERVQLEKGLSVLATLGANAPFIGLFGTVLGIIRAFAALGDTSGSASSVMSGISQALVATAAGLFVAIPAVVAFNMFSSRIRTLVSQCEALKDQFLAEGE